MAWRSICGKKGRSALTILSIFIGIAAVMTIVSTMEGMKAKTMEQFAAMGANRIEVSVYAYMYDEGGNPISKDYFTGLYRFCSGLKESIIGITPKGSSNATVVYGTKNSSTMEWKYDQQYNVVSGPPQIYYGSDQYSACNNLAIAKGRDLAWLDCEKYNQICVLGAQAARVFFGSANPVGQIMKVNGNNFEVVGVYGARVEPDTPSAYQTDNFMILPYTATRLLGDTAPTEFLVKAKDDASMKTAITEIGGYLSGVVDQSMGGYQVQKEGYWQDYQNQQLTMISLVLGGMFGVALLLARGIVHLLKGSLRGHHPKELLDLYLQQDDLLNSIEDGLVATDLRGQVVFANDQARTLLQCGSTPLEGQPLTRFFPETGCIQVARSGQAVHNRSCVIQERQILASEVPILGENGSQGVLNVFHDKTEMRKLSDELSGARYMLDTLRFFNHEFMNKLHIILGYLQTGESQKAVQFIMNTSLVTSQSIRETADCIRVSHLCALIIGKMMHAAELGILLTVTHDSFCREEDLLLSPEDYATILGNLLENAIDELSRSHSEVREIKLSMYCRPDCNLVVCEDTGGGIAPDILPHIWDKGFSSKGEGRGFGLYLISRLVDEHGGCIELETEPGVGTCFTLTFTREE